MCSALSTVDDIQNINLASVVQNIDTDQIIPAEYLTLVPSKVRILSSTNYIE